jgi:Xaa-Pro aminopeptidase
MNERVQRVMANINKDGVDGIIISGGSDIKYLTGFTGDYGVSVLVVTPAKMYFITDGRFEFQAQKEVPDAEVIIYSSTQAGYFGAAGELIQELGLKHVGIQADRLTHQDYLTVVAGNTTSTFTDIPDFINTMRRVKTPAEIALIRRACDITERSLYALYDFIKPGVTEIEIANELEYQFRSRGGDGYCFETIVASGPENGANPHATPSDRKIELGDFVTIDFGTGYHGYCSDETRTIAVGKPKNPEMMTIYNTVKAAKQAGEAVLKAGLGMDELDAVVRAIVAEAGYSIPHGIGHSFGLDIHEAPFISAKNPYKLEKNVIHTLEPGIYIPGVCGVRIEDDYLITENGAERLQQSTNNLITL